MLKYCTNFNVNVACRTYFQNGAIRMPPRKWGRAGWNWGPGCATPPLIQKVDNLFQFMQLFMLSGSFYSTDVKH